MEKIYLDYNATTPLAKEVIEAISKSLTEDWGNPSSWYEYGRKAREVIEKAREEIAKMIGAESEEIIFTSGGTEANNMVISTIARKFAGSHIVTSALEHPSVKCPIEASDKITMSFISANKQSGYAVDVENIVSAIQPNTKLVTLMLANNETGVIQPVQEVARVIKKLNPNILIHTDAAQAIGKIVVDVKDLKVDFLTIVGHKFYGPRIGALYVRKGCDILPLMYGGNQESSLRSGTENTPMIVGLGEAARLVNLNLNLYENHMRLVRDYMETKLKEIPNVIINGCSPLTERLPNTCNVSFIGFHGYEILRKCVFTLASPGAACHSGKNTVSSILLASGIEENIAVGALRLSVGRETSINDIDVVVNELKNLVNK